MKIAKFFAEVFIYVPFFYEDGEQDGYEPSKKPLMIEADSVSEMAEKLTAMDDIHNVCVWVRDSADIHGYMFFLKDIRTDADGDLAFCTLCDAIAYLMQWDGKFRELTIRYK